jgi:outer membrane protein OmpA-like peptidoglycan-associated protein
MANNFDIVSGNFRGYFYTNQKVALASGEKVPEGNIHEIHLYQGELNDVVKESEYKPETLRNRESLVLHNVTNVQFHLNSATESKKQIYDFEQLLLNNPVVENSWELNGKTYGIVSGNLLGKVKQLSSIAGPINPPPNPNPPNNPNPPINPNPINNGGNGSNNNGGKSNGGNGSNNGGGGNGGGNNNGGNGSSNGGGNTGGSGANNNGCFTSPLALLSGCLANMWRILLFLFLLGLMLWLFKNCKGCSKETKKDCCEELEIEKKKNKVLTDSLVKLSHSKQDTVKKSKKEKLQDEIKELASKIYFYGGTSNIRKYSKDEIDEIVSVLKNNPNIDIEVAGFFNPFDENGKRVLNTENTTIDKERAQSVKNLFIENGIAQERIKAIGKGESRQASILEKDEEGQFNNNMRVEITIIKY